MSFDLHISTCRCHITKVYIYAWLSSNQIAVMWLKHSSMSLYLQIHTNQCYIRKIMNLTLIFPCKANKNFGPSMWWSQYHGDLAVTSLPRAYTLTYKRPRKVTPIIWIIAWAPHYSTTTIFNGICLVYSCIQLKMCSPFFSWWDTKNLRILDESLWSLVFKITWTKFSI